MDIEKIKINCIISDSIDCYQYHIMIYNNEQELITDAFTIDGTYEFKVPYCGIYYFLIVPNYPLNPRYIWQKIYLNILKQKEIVFFFNKNCIEKENVHPITFYITDSHYQGLKIGKGEMNLWQGHM